jgi:hypothetical protein
MPKRMKRCAILAAGLMLGAFDAYATDAQVNVPKLTYVTITIPTTKVNDVVNPGTLALSIEVPVKHVLRLIHSTKRGAKHAR